MLQITWEVPNDTFNGGNIKTLSKEISTISEGFDYKQANNLRSITFIYKNETTGAFKTESCFGEYNRNKVEKTIAFLKTYWRFIVDEHDQSIFA